MQRYKKNCDDFKNEIIKKLQINMSIKKVKEDKKMDRLCDCIDDF